MCGENHSEIATLAKQLGSPPRVRGKPSSTFHNFLLIGITPACAGKTRVKTPDAFRREDHPRVCGENTYFSPSLLVSSGSPPRVRGKHPAPKLRKAIWRITPACAGKTSHWKPLLPEFLDHPRVCGENGYRNWYNRGKRGSPPRVRGKRRQNFLSVANNGITPACAGKTEMLYNAKDIW